ncbi:hypothetical protein FB446DRAFT_709716 [Lentinula raphanica]|nr:hypothetical protein FB446DRAFT_709716 [Lentinula raphanica]
MSFIHQPHSIEITPLGIPTYDHGLQRRVYRYWPLDRAQRPVPIKRLWAIRKYHLDEWEIFCDCTPLPGTFGIPARIWTISQTTSRFYGRTFIGCGKHRCTFKACLDDIYTSVLALGQFPNPNYPPPPTPPTPPATNVPLHPEINRSSPLPSSPLPSADNNGASIPSPEPASQELVDPQAIFDEIWAAFQEYDENPVQQELVQLFAGQRDVIITPDGAIHFDPDLFPQNDASTLDQGIRNGPAVPSSTSEENIDELYEGVDGDITLVDIDLNDINGDVGKGKLKDEYVLPGNGTKVKPYDLTTQKFLFIELCNTCGNDVEDHDATASFSCRDRSTLHICIKQAVAALHDDRRGWQGLSVVGFLVNAVILRSTWFDAWWSIGVDDLRSNSQAFNWWVHFKLECNACDAEEAAELRTETLEVNVFPCQLYINAKFKCTLTFDSTTAVKKCADITFDSRYSNQLIANEIGVVRGREKIF